MSDFFTNIGNNYSLKIICKKITFNSPSTINQTNKCGGLSIKKIRRAHH